MANLRATSGKFLFAVIMFYMFVIQRRYDHVLIEFEDFTLLVYELLKGSLAGNRLTSNSFIKVRRLI